MVQIAEITPLQHSIAYVEIPAAVCGQLNTGQKFDTDHRVTYQSKTVPLHTRTLFASTLVRKIKQCELQSKDGTMARAKYIAISVLRNQFLVHGTFISS